MEGHNIERVGNHEDERVGGMFDDFGDDGVEDSAVLFGEIETGFTRLLGGAGGKDNEIGACEIFVRRSGGDCSVGVKRLTIFEIGFFAFGFVNLAGEED